MHGALLEQRNYFCVFETNIDNSPHVNNVDLSFLNLLPLETEDNRSSFTFYMKQQQIIPMAQLQV